MALIPGSMLDPLQQVQHEVDRLTKVIKEKEKKNHGKPLKRTSLATAAAEGDIIKVCHILNVSPGKHKAYVALFSICIRIFQLM
jgi:hypothetical protein